MKWMMGLDKFEVTQRRTIDTIVSNPETNHCVKEHAEPDQKITPTHALFEYLAKNMKVRMDVVAYNRPLEAVVESGLMARKSNQVSSRPTHQHSSSVEFMV